MRFLLIAVLAVSMAIETPGSSLAGVLATDDLVGSWVLHYDPDNAPRDFIDFYKDSSVDIRGEDGDHFICSYSAFETEVTIKCQVRGQEKVLKLHVGKSSTELVNPDGAIYWKIPDQEGITYNRSGWNTLVSKEGKFTVLFFGVPSIEKVALKSPAGEGQATHYRSKFGGAMYMVHALTLPVGVGTEESRKQALENYQGSLLENFKTFAKGNDTMTVDQVQDVVVQGAAAKKVNATIVRAANGKRYSLTGVVLIRGDMLYQLNAMVQDQEELKAVANEFLASFVATD